MSNAVKICSPRKSSHWINSISYTKYTFGLRVVVPNQYGSVQFIKSNLIRDFSRRTCSSLIVSTPVRMDSKILVVLNNKAITLHKQNFYSFVFKIRKESIKTSMKPGPWVAKSLVSGVLHYVPHVLAAPTNRFVFFFCLSFKIIFLNKT